MKFFTTFVSAIVLTASAVTATPIAKVANLASSGPKGPATLIVYSPHVTAPTAGQIWTTGSNQTVTWDTSDIPEEKQDSPGMLLLGYLEDGSENLDINTPLAVNFPLSGGNVTFTVPVVDTRTDYVVVLFGDSGNTSPQFTIFKA